MVEYLPTRVSHGLRGSLKAEISESSLSFHHSWHSAHTIHHSTRPAQIVVNTLRVSLSNELGGCTHMVRSLQQRVTAVDGEKRPSSFQSLPVFRGFRSQMLAISKLALSRAFKKLKNIFIFYYSQHGSLLIHSAERLVDSWLRKW